MHSIELFAGCGGLALGISQAGFNHRLVVERDSNACSTLTVNQERNLKHIAGWPLITGDVQDIDYTRIEGKIDLVSGGPPCQPFSIGGKHKGPKDKRNMWPEAIRCVQEVSPRAFIFENVRGLLRPAFSDYLKLLQLQLSFPNIKQNRNETEGRYLARLIALEKKGIVPTYHVVVNSINAADFGASQKRHRALVIGIKTDVASKISFPSKTHSHEALIWDQYISGDYWERHDISKRSRPSISITDKKILKKLELSNTKPSEKPWVTVRDTLCDLPPPKVNTELVPNHVLHPGARVYEGHTGSRWDEPAKALKAGAHGVPGGENILVEKDKVRYFTIREMARLQGLPDDYLFLGSWVSSIKQLGNAVPVQVGHFFGSEVFKILDQKKTSLKKT